MSVPDPVQITVNVSNPHFGVSPPKRPTPPDAPSATRLLPRRFLGDRIILRERRVQRPPRAILNNSPRRRPPAEHLTDPRVQHVPAITTASANDRIVPPPLPPIPRSYDNKNMMILRGTLPVPLAQTAEGAPISSVFWGDRPSRKQIGYRMSLNAPLHHPIPYRRNPRRRTFPASFRISTSWLRSRTPTACRGARVRRIGHGRPTGWPIADSARRRKASSQ